MRWLVEFEVPSPSHNCDIIDGRDVGVEIGRQEAGSDSSNPTGPLTRHGEAWWRKMVVF